MHTRPHAVNDLRLRYLFAPEVNGLFLGFLTVEDRDPWDHDISAGGMEIWLRYVGPLASQGIST